ncbi:hypothetical protein CALCODRAFT_210645 [Calocera cornea HHB12733]|uniref:Uncharacterized protein n=1 Tax=Calocera cornea HHB12733 TaxID=1353952 RepID=A0A165HEK9_9BASI|nr:hypothetical protein CALCODRAFT_210645 [Calocera cornea HHB12733]
MCFQNYNDVDCTLSPRLLRALSGIASQHAFSALHRCLSGDSVNIECRVGPPTILTLKRRRRRSDSLIYEQLYALDLVSQRNRNFTDCSGASPPRASTSTPIRRALCSTNCGIARPCFASRAAYSFYLPSQLCVIDVSGASTVVVINLPRAEPCLSMLGTIQKAACTRRAGAWYKQGWSASMVRVWKRQLEALRASR